MIALSGSKTLSNSSLYPPASTTKYASDSDSHPETSLTPAHTTPCDTPPSKTSRSDDLAELDPHRMSNQARMDGPKTDDITTQEGDRLGPGGDGSAPKAEPNAGTLAQGGSAEKCKKKHKHEQIKKKPKRKTHGKKPKQETDDDDSSSSESSSSEDEAETSDSESSSASDSELDSEEERRLRKHKRRKAHRESQRPKHRRRGKPRRHYASSVSDSSSESYDDDEDEDSDLSEPHVSRRSKGYRSRKKSRAKKHRKEAPDFDDEGNLDPILEDLQAQMLDLDARLVEATMAAKQSRHATKTNKSGANGRRKGKGKRGKHRHGGSSKREKRASRLEYKRVDQLWDNSIHNYKLTDTAEDDDADEYDQYLFTVRRQFDWKGKYTDTVVDIKSQILKDTLQEVMDGAKGVSLVEDTPTVDPNMLFLYLEELRTAMKQMKKKRKTEKKRKARKLLTKKATHLKVLLSYLDEDYAETKKTLYPLLESNLITFDLLWALFKPNTIAYTTTYGNVDEPRAFKVEYASKESSFQRGEWYSIEGRYLEYDGKSFGMGTMEVDVDSFKGARKITSLATYPLIYHKDQIALRQQLIERGRKFVSLAGMNYRFHRGMAFFKKKRGVAKVNINGRVMIDSATHRRINPNYPVSTVKPSEDDVEGSEEDSDEDSCCGCNQSSDEDAEQGDDTVESIDEETEPRHKVKVMFKEDGTARVVSVEVDSEGEEIKEEKIEKLDDDGKPNREFTEEQLLLASPVVLGFAFSEKLWLELTVSGVKDIEWNEGAFDSLVLPDNQKSIVKALVESHTFHAAQNIEDVIQGKGKGLVAVLHGPPGTGKTLTAEGIAELLKRPLYMVTAGELGTDPRTLEGELNKLLDLSHSWGAVLLLDEADVFLEKRTIQDIHRNALVSIFLRLLEYFQGILFLTTNRVETFDDAFQSRIHLALRYGELQPKARKAVWKLFIDRVRAKEGLELAAFKESDFDTLARNDLNGRQIKNCVRTAQALAVNNKEKLSMEHIKRVLDVIQNFDKELKGGPGYVEAMRSYT
ncbi:MAG: hypothetical protein M1816_000693 [Peltula sp. TS41687]|nr:MAG: hypothetical protein M1816_000693 [Peltula sp. TS41687]